MQLQVTTVNRHRLLISLLALAQLATAACDESIDAEDELAPGEYDTIAFVNGRIEAEAFAPGGEGSGYHDTNANNLGKAYRAAEGVDIEACRDVGGGFNVGWIEAGEWLAYDITVDQAGPYDVTLRVASAQSDARSMHLELDGQRLAGGSATLTGGAGWQTWTNVATGRIQLPAGVHELKLFFDSGKLNVNYIDLKYAGPPPVAPVIMGMFNNTALAPAAEVSTPKNFRDIANRFMVGTKIKVNRSFNPNLPASYSTSAAAQDPAYGNVSFLSVKPPNDDFAGVAAGRYDATIRSLAGSMPAGSYLTMYHEPEDNMTGTQFVAMFRRFYSVAKGANPALSIGYAAMAYQWRPGSPTTANKDEWWPGADSTDWLAVDVYAAGWHGDFDLGVHPYFQRWYTWAKAKGKPLLLAEWAVEAASTGGFSDAARADNIRRSMAWVMTQPQIKMVLWWNGTSSTPGAKDHVLNPTTSLPDTYAQARKAWNDMVTLYGTTATKL